MSIDLRPGEVFAGRYRIEHALKSGGMGALYVAVHVATGRRTALKLMHPHIVNDAGARARFAQEATVSSMIDSGGIVDVLDAGVDPATMVPFLVMELLTGRDLGEIVRERPGGIAPEQVVDWIAQVARALDRAHEQKIIHRDLKPENLFLAERRDEAPRIKILDFGIAKILAGSLHHSTQSAGTPLYMAPEQTKRGEITHQADIWALGLITYTLLTGTPYWEAETIHALYAEILGGQYPSAIGRARTRGVTLPSSFDAWFSRCVAVEPAQRFRSAGEAATALRQTFEGHQPEPARLDRTMPWQPPVENLMGRTTEPVLSKTAPMPEPPEEPSPATEPAPPEIEPSREVTPPETQRKTPQGLLASVPKPLLGAAFVGVGTLVFILAFDPFGRRSKTTDAPSAQPTAAPTRLEFPKEFPSTIGAPEAAVTAAAPDVTPFPSGARCPVGMLAVAGGGRTTPFPVPNVAPFCLDETEVTVTAYGGCVAAGKCKAPGLYDASDKEYGRWCNWKRDGAALHPINCVAPADAKAYCKWLDKRLPSDDEYDWVMHGGAKGTTNPWGNELSAGHVCGATNSTCEVGSVPLGNSPEGVKDLVGNVEEWVDFDDGAKNVIARGGFAGWSDAAGNARNGRESLAYSLTGFRCAKSP